MKTWLLYLTFLVSALSLSAQQRWSSGLGVEGGYSGKSYFFEEGSSVAPFGNYHGRIDARPYPGMGLEVWVEYRLHRRIGLYTGFNFSQWTKYTAFESGWDDFANQPVSRKYTDFYERQQQLRFPLLFKFYFGSSAARNQLFLTGGMQGAYLLSHHTITLEEYGSSTQIANETSSEAEAFDLENGWAATERNALAYVAGFGLRRDRVTISLERSWKERRLTNNYPYNCLGGVEENCFRPPAKYTIRNYYQTSLHFRYQLF